MSRWQISRFIIPAAKKVRLLLDSGRTSDNRCCCHLLAGSTLLLLASALREPSLLIPRRDLQIGGREVRHHLKERTSHLLVWIKLLSEAPIRLTARIARCLPDIAKEQIRLQHIGALSEHILTDLGGHIGLPIAPERLGETDPRIKAVGGLIDHTAKLLDSLGQHMAFGIESCEARAAEAQRRTLGTPNFRIEAQKLRA